MYPNFVRCLLFIPAAYATPLLAAAPGPIDSGAAVPPVAYESAFSGYRAYADEPLADWRTINDEVARIGGHAGVLREQPADGGHGLHKPEQAVREVPAVHGQAPARAAPNSAAEHRHDGNN